MPMVDASYDHIVVNSRDMLNFLEMFEEVLRAALEAARPENKTFKIFIDPRAQNPMSRNLPSIDVKVFYHKGWQFTDAEKEALADYLRPFLEESSQSLKLKKDNLKVRLYPREDPISISV